MGNVFGSDDKTEKKNGNNKNDNNKNVIKTKFTNDSNTNFDNLTADVRRNINLLYEAIIKQNEAKKNGTGGTYVREIHFHSHKPDSAHTWNDYSEITQDKKFFDLNSLLQESNNQTNNLTNNQTNDQSGGEMEVYSISTDDVSEARVKRLRGGMYAGAQKSNEDENDEEAEEEVDEDMRVEEELPDVESENEDEDEGEEEDNEEDEDDEEEIEAELDGDTESDSDKKKKSKTKEKEKKKRKKEKKIRKRKNIVVCITEKMMTLPITKIINN